MKGHWIVSILAGILILGSLGLSHQVFALTTPVTHFDVENCDFLFVDPIMDELGNGTFSVPLGPFPADESIIASSGFTGVPGSACPSSFPLPSSTTIAIITNTVTPPRAFTDVYYVGDTETSFTNVDGFVDGGSGPLPAFRIDSVDSFGGCGLNCPLFFEVATSDGIWEPGETWHFSIDDYFNSLSIPAGNINSTGLGSGAFPILSSGSILVFDPSIEGPVGGTLIPIDSTALLVTGAQTTTPWLVLGVVAAVGIGLAVFTIKRSR